MIKKKNLIGLYPIIWMKIIQFIEFLYPFLLYICFCPFSCILQSFLIKHHINQIKGLYIDVSLNKILLKFFMLDYRKKLSSFFGFNSDDLGKFQSLSISWLATKLKTFWISVTKRRENAVSIID
ncbi:MAG: hypothetical protein C0168_03880 [Candidatus Aminicenantes bacterium]|nr:MAG: hypothetical protein C0168_03880 [Candidatus Aminicenantes bacterium]